MVKLTKGFTSLIARTCFNIAKICSIIQYVFYVRAQCLFNISWEVMKSRHGTPVPLLWFTSSPKSTPQMQPKTLLTFTVTKAAFSTK